MLLAGGTGWNGASRAGAQGVTPPSAPLDLQASAGHRSVDLLWEFPQDWGGGSLDGFWSRHKLASDPDVPDSWTEINQGFPLGDLDATVTGLTEWEVYDFQVAAENSAGIGSWSGSVQATPHRSFGLDTEGGAFEPYGLWSDGTTIWVTDADGASRANAYTLDGGGRDSAGDLRFGAGIERTRGICSNSSRVWVAAPDAARVSAHDMSGTVVAAESIDLDSGVVPAGLWCDDDELLVVDAAADRVLAYDLSNRARDAGRDIAALGSGNTDPTGVWTDGDTVWVADSRDGKAYAYGWDNGHRRPDMDMEGLASGRPAPRGVWSDGVTMWVANSSAAVDGHPLPGAADGGPSPWWAQTSADGASVTVHFSETVDAATVGAAASAFSVRVGSAAAAAPTAATRASDAAAVELTLAAAAGAGERVRLAYDDPTGGDDAAAVLQDGDGDDAASFSDFIVWNRPAAPASLNVTAGDTAIDTGWQAPSLDGGDAVRGYEVQYKASTATDWLTAARVDPAALYETLTGLTNSTEYDVRVRASNRGGDGPWSATSQATPTAAATVPGPARSVAAVGGLQQVAVSWQRPGTGSPQSYAVQYRVKGTTAWLTATRSDPAALSETIASLAHATTYEIRVRGVNTAGPSGWSPTVEAATTSPPAAAGDVAVAGSFKSVTVTWDEPDDDGGAPITGYKVQYRLSGATAWTDANRDDVLAREEVVAGLDVGSTYQARVAATNAAGTGAWSDPLDGVPHREISLDDVRAWRPLGLWGNGTTLWTMDPFTARGHAFSLTDGTYQPEKDFTGPNHIRTFEGPFGIWSDDDTVWVSFNFWRERGGDIQKLLAFELATGDRLPDQDLTDLDMGQKITPRGIWSDGDTIWVIDITPRPYFLPGGGLFSRRISYQIRAYDLATGDRDADKDFPFIADIGGYSRYGNRNRPTDLWSDGATMWVTDDSSTVHAFSMSTKERSPSRNLQLPSGHRSAGIWSDGTEMWVVDAGNDPFWLHPPDRIYGYDLPPKVAPGAPDIGVVSGSEVLTVELLSIDDGGSPVSGFEVQYRHDTATDWTDVTHSGVSDLANLSAQIPNLTNGDEYRVRARATNAVGTGDWRERTAVPNKGFDTLDRANGAPSGLWSDGTTMWVSDQAGDVVYAYDLDTTLRTPGRDFKPHARVTGLWSDDSTMWLLRSSFIRSGYANEIRALSLADGSRVTDKDVTTLDHSLGQDEPFGLWSDGTTVWVGEASSANKVFAYDLATGARSRDHEFDTVKASGLKALRGLWSDGDTMWVSGDLSGREWILAFSMHTKARVSRDIDVGYLSQNSAFFRPVLRTTPPSGKTRAMWSDGDTMYVAVEDRIVAFDVPAAAAPKAPTGVGSDPGNGWLEISWTASGDDGGSRLVSFDVEYRESTAGGTEAWLLAETVTAEPDGGEHNARVTGLANGTSYDVRVRATNSVGDSVWAELAAPGTPALALPGEPRGLVLVSGDGVLGASWDAPANSEAAPVASYLVQHRLSGAWTDIVHTDLADLSTLVTGLTNGSSYQVRVAARNAAGAGPWATASAAPSPDFDTLAAAGNDHPTGIWSDDATMWVADQDDTYVYAYDLTTTVQDTDAGFDLASGNTAPLGIASDGTTMWVLDYDSGGDSDKLYAYTLSNGNRLSSRDIDLHADNTQPYGLWTDGDTMWVSDWSGDDKLYAYALSDGSRDAGKDIDTLAAAGVQYVFGIASDDAGTTWAADWDNVVQRRAHLYAFSTATAQRVPSRDAALGASSAVAPKGLWSDGTTMWVVAGNRIRAVDLPPASAPKAPADLASSPRDGELTVSWNGPGDDGGAAVTAYDVRHRRNSPQGSWTTVSRSDAAALSETVGGLTNSVAYDVEVRARNAQGPGPWARTTGTPVTDDVEPGAPQSLAATPGDGSLVVAWAAPASDGGAAVTSYTLRHRRQTPQGTWQTATHTDLASLTSTITGLTNGAAYDVQVAATNTAGTGPWATTAAAPVMPVQAPSEPRSLTATSRTGSLVVAWAAPASDGGAAVTSYTVRYRQKTPQGPWQTVARTDAAALTETIDGLTNGTAYDVEVAATNTADTGPWADISATPQAELPGMPNGLRATQGSLIVSWAPPDSDGGADITEYMVRYRPDVAASAWTDIDPRNDPAALTERITGLANETYVVAVAAVNSVGTGPWAEHAATVAAGPRAGSSAGSGGSVGAGSSRQPQEEPTAAQQAAGAFEDVDEDAYYAPSVAWMTEHSITDGCIPAMFCPDALLTREQFTMFLWRAAGRPEPAEPGSGLFADVDAGSLADPAIGWASQTGITEGCRRGQDDGAAADFCPRDQITRAQLATMLYRYIHADDAQAPPAETDFTDIDPDAYYAPAVAWMTAHEITTGCRTGTFCPADTATRAETAVFMHRIHTTPDSWATEQGIIRTPADN